MTVEELLDRLSASELAEWQAYYQYEPFGEAWRQTAYQCAMIGNAAGGKRGGRAWRPEEFLPAKPPLRYRSARQTPEQMLSIFRLLATQTA